MKDDRIQLSKDYVRIEKAIRFLQENFENHPGLKDIAKVAGVSEYHFQRIFQRWAGVSPKRFLQFLTKEHARAVLKNSSVLDAAYAAGLSAPGRMHDLFVKYEAMSPGEYKHKGQGPKIEYGFHPSPLGDCFIALTDRGICGLSFVEKSSRKNMLAKFRKQWNKASLAQNQKRTQGYVRRIFTPWTTGMKKFSPMKLLCQGTNFQIKVWEAILKIPPGKLATYATVAESIGHARSVRAVGHAIGENPIAYLIPCHRVIRSGGHLGGYRWGIVRKKAILAKEAALFGI